MKQGFVYGDNKSQCHICGRVYKSSEIRPQWDNVLACPRCYNTKHPDLDPIIAPKEDPRPDNFSPRSVTYVDDPGVSVWGGIMNNGREYGTEWTWDAMEISWDELTFDDFR